MEELINEKKTDTEKKTGTRLLGSNRISGVLALIAALSAAGAVIAQPFIVNEQYYCEYSDYYEGMDDRQAGVARAKYCRDSVYSDLCTLASVYLPNCTDGVYGGGRDIYEAMYAGLSQFDPAYTSQNENIFGLKNAGSRAIKIEQSKYTITNIDSDYYNFYISYGGESLTNIEGLGENATPADTLRLLTEKYPDWYYLREGSEIRTRTKYDESGLTKTEVYYTTAGSDGAPALTSEYIDSDKLVVGSCSKDNYGRYICCFSGEGDKTIPEPLTQENYQLGSDGSLHIMQFVMNEQTNEPLSDGYVEFTVPQNSEDYRRFLGQNGGVYDKNGSWLELSEMSDYTMTPVDMSKLTLFMSPKTDIVEASVSFISKHRSLKKVFGITMVSLIALFGVSMPASLVFMLVRRKEKYAEDGSPLVYRLFKTDSSFVILGASLTLLLHTAVWAFLRDPAQLPLGTVSVRRSCMAAGAVIALMLSLSGIVRQFKLKGFGERRQEYLSADVMTATKPFRDRVKAGFYGSAFMRSMARLSPLARNRMKFFTALGSGALFLFGTAVIGNDVGLLLFSPAGIICVISLIAYIVGADRTARDVGRLTKQAESMLGAADGEIRSVKNELETYSPVYTLGEKLESVSGAAEKAVEEQLKSERMKIELVTNVSHDLKTPLTSIISYIDLLSKSELSDEARDYVSILSRKADKLRDIVADVFSLAKAVSGVEVELTELDLAVLSRQVIADIQDKAELSGRELKAEIQPIHAPITADGGKLYRVIQNLLDNALKYSMNGSRVYATLTENAGGFELEVRNICEREPDFTAEEILERFARGDSSRSDGGSGLGLSIAKSFTEACGGSFEVVLDKDIFTAYVRFARRADKAPEQTETEEAPKEI